MSARVYFYAERYMICLKHFCKVNNDFIVYTVLRFFKEVSHFTKYDSMQS